MPDDHPSDHEWGCILSFVILACLCFPVLIIPVILAVILINTFCKPK